MDAPTRVLTAIAHEEPDRVPGFESSFINDTIMREFGFPDASASPILRKMDLLRFLPFYQKIMRWGLSNRNLVARSYLPMAKFNRASMIDVFLALTGLFPRKIIKGGFIDENGRHMQRIQYDGDGTEITAYIDGMLKDFNDYLSWEQPRPDDPRRLTGFLAAYDVQKELNNEIFAVPASGALMECTWEVFGMRNFSRILRKESQIRRVFDDRGKFTLELVKIFADHGAKLVLLYDDYGFKNGTLMNPVNYRKYIFPWLKQICDAAHRSDCKILLHSDGDLTAILDDIVACGVDALNPIEPTTANPNYDIFKLAPQYKSKITLVGNISPQLMSTGTKEEVIAYAKRLLLELGPGGGYIFSSGHSVNPSIPVDIWKAVLDVRQKFGNYPIKNSIA
jgi:hypothetical protein